MCYLLIIFALVIIIIVSVAIIAAKKDREENERCKLVDNMICPDCGEKLEVVERIPWGFRAKCKSCGSIYKRKYMEY